MNKKQAWKVEQELIDRFLNVLADNGFKWRTGCKANEFRPLEGRGTVLFIEQEPKTLMFMGYSYYLDESDEEYNISEVTEELLEVMEYDGVARTLVPERLRKDLWELICDVEEDECEHDPVNHPEHYKGLEGLEVRTVQENFVPKYEKYGVMVACDIKDSIKYILRAPDKGGVEDLKKAVRMLNYAIEGWENEQ